MLRLNLTLLVSLIASALYLVQVQYESRRLYTEIERAQAEARKLEIDNERLQVDKRAQATSARVEKLAREQLHMRPATPAITQYVTLKGAAQEKASAARPPEGAGPLRLRRGEAEHAVRSLGEVSP
ncbi:MAG TPA: cell division protein FtsL [Ramlibacter sp.]|nr:cell division protein FtsL [Ramlibacter sp.]HET8749011.1 cell division protein FtsL [Ramlibacter sp.]